MTSCRACEELCLGQGWIITPAVTVIPLISLPRTAGFLPCHNRNEVKSLGSHVFHHGGKEMAADDALLGKIEEEGMESPHCLQSIRKTLENIPPPRFAPPPRGMVSDFSALWLFSVQRVPAYYVTKQIVML